MQEGPASSANLPVPVPSPEDEKSPALQGEEAPASADSAPALVVDAKPSAIARIEQRLASADSPQEIVLWSQIRREVIQQDIFWNQENQLIWRERTQDVYKIAISFCAFFAGIFLFVTGFTLPGFFVCGAGIASFAQGWAMGFLSTVLPFGSAPGASALPGGTEGDSRDSASGRSAHG